MTQTMTECFMTPSVLKQVCVIDGCDNQHIARGYCPKHYYHARKAGLGPRPEKLPTRFPTYCTQDGCDAPNKGHGLCEFHYVRWVYRGRVPEHLTDGSLLERVYSAPWKGKKGPAAPRWSGDAVDYSSAHKRVRAMKGKASSHLCVDCGGPAAHWSYIGGDPDERKGPRHDDPTKLIAYSLDPGFYSPRCVADHVAFDRRM